MTRTGRLAERRLEALSETHPTKDLLAEACLGTWRLSGYGETGQFTVRVKVVDAAMLEFEVSSYPESACSFLSRRHSL
jgi:hypothetical protein